MTVYHLDEIAGDVRIALDQNTTSDVLKEIGDVDTLALNDIIKSKIIEAVKRVHSSAPPYLLDGGHNFGDEVYWQKCESGWVLLPEDFMRFVVFQMSDWERAVSCKSQDATVSRAVYLPYPKIDKYGAIEICQRCYDAVVYTIAALVLTTFGDVEKSSALNELAKSVLI